jgi:glucose/arabinose dehydrogenase
MQHCLKIVILLSVLTLAFVNNNMLSVIIRQARAATPYSDPRSTNAITKIQMPGIIHNDNNPHLSPPASPQTVTALPPKIRNTRAPPALTGPTLNDHNLKVEQIIDRSFDDATSMTFLGPNDILVLEKNTGIVHRILNGKILPKPLLDVNVANQAERGLLGIAIANDNASTENGNTRHVFLYYTESGGGKQRLIVSL